MKIILPWPDARLSPNARLHWRAKVGPKQAAKIAAGHLTYAASRGLHDALEAMQASDEPIPMTITFYPPDKRHRDDDNMIGAFKSWRDGIADALSVNDRRFRPHYIFADPCKPGRVEVDISPISTGEHAENELQEHEVFAMQKNGPSGALTPPSRDQLADRGAN